MISCHMPKLDPLPKQSLLLNLGTHLGSEESKGNVCGGLHAASQTD